MVERQETAFLSLTREQQGQLEKGVCVRGQLQKASEGRQGMDLGGLCAQGGVPWILSQ